MFINRKLGHWGNASDAGPNLTRHSSGLQRTPRRTQPRRSFSFELPLFPGRLDTDLNRADPSIMPRLDWLEILSIAMLAMTAGMVCLMFTQ